MKAKNAKVGTRVQVKLGVDSFYDNKLGTIVEVGGPLYAVRVNIDASPLLNTGFAVHELRRVK